MKEMVKQSSKVKVECSQPLETLHTNFHIALESILQGLTGGYFVLTDYSRLLQFSDSVIQTFS